MAEGNSSATRTAAESIAVVAFYLYFGGWVYANAMFDDFGMSLTLIEIPAYFFVVYSFSVFFTTCTGWILVIMIGGAWYALARYRFVRWAEICLVVGIATVPFPIVRMLAEARAHADAAAIRVEGKTVRFVLREKASAQYPADLVKLAGSGQLKLVLQTKERYFAVLQPKGLKGKNNRVAYPPASVYDLPTADFIAIITTRDTAR